MKGDSSTHIPNDKYRENYDQVFRKQPAPGGVQPDEAVLYLKDGDHRHHNDEDEGFWP